MALHKIKDFDPDYRSHFDGDDVVGLDLYTGNDKIGSVDDALVDDEGQFRYLVINTGVWILGKKVLLPIGGARIDYVARRVYAKSLSKAQVENLPEFTQDATIDYDHEEQVRGIYRPSMLNTAASGVGYVGDSAPAIQSAAPMLDVDAGYDRDTYSYDKEPALYGVNEQDHQTLRLYQERLIASKTRQKTGEVAIGKHIETETARVSVPIDKERVVIQRTAGNTGAVIPASEANFQAGEVARIEVYEEIPNIQKEAFVREEVRVTKVVDHDTVTAEEQVRREELDVDTEGRPVVEKKL
ncbi:DUF2382 domain-containing protein [Phormidesmis priestleyi]|uniref:DUF2382 domain-containing protein n=1 Tax=Phormidesmis priestleyi TaxID=268141 RepID=UPI00083B946F|nr:DUF2382 domain-containing protein [Phormidesmis priestleyi]